MAVALSTQALRSNAPAYSVEFYGTPGTYTFVVPADVFEIFVTGCGGGAGGGGGHTTSTGGGGGGGGHGFGVLWEPYRVSPGDVLTITVGTGGAGGNAGSAGTAGGFSQVSGSSVTDQNTLIGSNGVLRMPGGSAGTAGTGTLGGNGGNPGLGGSIVGDADGGSGGSRGVMVRPHGMIAWGQSGAGGGPGNFNGGAASVLAGTNVAYANGGTGSAAGGGGGGGSGGMFSSSSAGGNTGGTGPLTTQTGYGAGGGGGAQGQAGAAGKAGFVALCW